MVDRKPPEELTILEAVDNLSTMVELDQPSEEKTYAWADPKQLAENQAKVKETFRTLHNYLQHVYKKDKEQLKEPQTQRGIQAIMVLAGEAAQKLDKYTSLFKGAQGASGLKEFKDLQQFYQTKLSKKFQEIIAAEEAWEEEWKQSPDHLDIERRGLKDLEMVRRDREYELFHIKKEDGRPFFNRNLLRHIKLIGDFDETVSDPTGEDPLLKLKVIQDRDVHFAAKEILRLAMPYIDEFYKEAMRHKEEEFVGLLNKALMALMLSSNPKNLLQNAPGKACINYYTDFHFFLRQALNNADYQQMIDIPTEERDAFSHLLINLSHALSCFFFLREERRVDIVKFIHHLVKNKETRLISNEPLSFWNAILEDDERIRTILKSYPNGPLLKTLDLFREGEEKESFDPLLEGNFPSQIFNFSQLDTHLTVLRLPAPIKQEFIDRAEIVEEFRGFLRFLGSKGTIQKHLLINLQDRTSWQEHARCAALEKFQAEAEFSGRLFVVTLAKNTDFYLQSSAYIDVDEASLFIQQFKEQIASGEECGFYFPPQLKTRQWQSFLDLAMEKIHRHFFAEKERLSRKNRLDFIEIFYQFLVLKLIEWLQPDSLSFTCKDAVDTGAAESSTFFAFLKIIAHPSPFTQEEKDILEWLLFSFALLIRERPLDIQRLNRAVSSLSALHVELDERREEVLQGISSLFENPLSKITINFNSA
jgi:hypothetical protein